MRFNLLRSFCFGTQENSSGMRPTGKLHLGHLHGALKNWVDLQESGKYDCFYFVADWHAITSEYSSTEGIKNNAVNMVIDRL